jgi:hypothetical protein
LPAHDETDTAASYLINPSSWLAARKNKVVNAAGRYETELTSSTPELWKRRSRLARDSGVR